jgi:putative phage-type endonuclease
MEEALALRKTRNKVKALRKKPQPEQRTEEWFKQRQTRITASEAASCLFRTERVCEAYVKEFGVSNFKYRDTEALSPYDTREEYIIKKCAAFYGENVFRDNPFTLWGKKYEEVANRLYMKVYGVQVHEFGLVSHPRLKWMAASPDGITTDGVMLEIKCPKSRKINTAAPPLYYWVQVQIQLETCDLQECDFLECEIEELKGEPAFRDCVLGEFQDIGIILQHNDISLSEPKFVYPPIELTTAQEYIDWKNTFDSVLFTPIYFYVTKYNTMRIQRSKEWFANVRDDIKRTWEFVTRLQLNRNDFEKYKESIQLLKNKKFIEKFNTTVCLVGDDDSVMAFEDSTGENGESGCMIETTE